MESLRIHLLGGLELYRGDQRLPAFPTQKSQGLFAFLVLHRGRRFARETLLGRFWGEVPEARARHSLRTGIWRMRKVLSGGVEGEVEYLALEDHQVGFNRQSDYWLDVEEFERALQEAGNARGAALEPGQAEALRRAMGLYRGDLLDGLYEDWCLHERERLRLRFLNALERLMEFHATRGEWEAAIGWGQRLLSLDPLLEQVHRAVMRYQLNLGNRPAALRQYTVCSELLQRELEVAPMDETTELADEIRRGLVVRLGVAVPPNPDPDDRLESVLKRLDATVEKLESCAATLEATARVLRSSMSAGGAAGADARPGDRFPSSSEVKRRGHLE